MDGEESAPQQQQREGGGHRPSRLLFGSCNSQFREQPLWPAIVARNASAFVWGGDAVYADQKLGSLEVPASPERLQQSYQQQLQQAGYRELMQHAHANRTTILGTWDDHDFGINNGGSDYPHKQVSALHFVDFLQQSSGRISPLLQHRAQQGHGVFSVAVFDFARLPGGDPLLSDEEAGIDPSVPVAAPLSSQSVAVFMLDVRYHKTPWNKDKRGERQTLLEGDYEGDFLGEAQWQWLEQGLARSTARVNIVVNGLQVHTDRWFDGNMVEDWSRYPASQHRLYQALLQPSVQAPLLVSGDVHMAEFLRRDCASFGQQQYARRSLVEVTTSGMTHAWGATNCPRQVSGEPVAWVCNNYVQSVIALAMHVSHLCHSWKELLDYTGPRLERTAKRRLQYSLALNFAEFDFDWQQSQVTVRILGTQPGPLLSATWELDTLSTSFPSDSPYGGSNGVPESDFARRYNVLRQNSGVSVQPDDWICLPNQGPIPWHIKVLAPLWTVAIGVVGYVGIPIVAPLVLLLYVTRFCWRRWYVLAKVKNE